MHADTLEWKRNYFIKEDGKVASREQEIISEIEIECLGEVFFAPNNYLQMNEITYLWFGLYPVRFIHLKKRCKIKTPHEANGSLPHSEQNLKLTGPSRSWPVRSRTAHSTSDPLTLNLPAGLCLRVRVLAVPLGLNCIPQCLHGTFLPLRQLFAQIYSFQ